LDIASTHTILSIGRKSNIVELNPYLSYDKGKENLFFSTNIIYLLILTVLASIYLIDHKKSYYYIENTDTMTFIHDIFSTKLDRNQDYVSAKIVIIVSIMVFVGAIGGARLLGFVNNVTEYYFDAGFVRFFSKLLHIRHPGILTITIAMLTSLMNVPIVYWVMRAACLK
jgi:hypothetical protein